MLVVRRSTDNAAKLEHALVALDGSGVAEESLPLVQELAGRPLQSVLLFRAVRDPQNRKPALTYLDAVAAQLAQSGLRVETAVEAGEPRSLIAEAAKKADLVVLCTHGRSGLSAASSKSAAS